MNQLDYEYQYQAIKPLSLCMCFKSFEIFQAANFFLKRLYKTLLDLNFSTIFSKEIDPNNYGNKLIF